MTAANWGSTFVIFMFWHHESHGRHGLPWFCWEKPRFFTQGGPTELYYMLFERSPSIFSMTSLKQRIEYKSSLSQSLFPLPLELFRAHRCYTGRSKFFHLHYIGRYLITIMTGTTRNFSRNVYPLASSSSISLSLLRLFHSFMTDCILKRRCGRIIQGREEEEGQCTQWCRFLSQEVRFFVALPMWLPPCHNISGAKIKCLLINLHHWVWNVICTTHVLHHVWLTHCFY